MPIRTEVRISAALGYVPTKDTSVVSAYLHDPAVVGNMPGDVKFLYGMAEKDKDGKVLDFVPLYAIKTVPGSDKAKLEGSNIKDAYQDFNSIYQPGYGEYEYG